MLELNDSGTMLQLYTFMFSVPISSELQDLLQKLLTKDPSARITLAKVREHPWIHKTTRRIPSVEENCLEEINVSEEDIQSAIKPFYTPIHILVSMLCCCVWLLSSRFHGRSEILQWELHGVLDVCVLTCTCIAYECF